MGTTCRRRLAGLGSTTSAPRSAAAGPAPRSPLESTMGRASAVLAALYDEDGEAHVVLTRRAWHLRSHRGEVSFPGGGRDPGEDLADTARREAWEEVQLDPSSIEMVGELDHLSTFTSRSWIVPFVAVLPGRPESDRLRRPRSRRCCTFRSPS